mgnify:CR=1 FL=1
MANGSVSGSNAVTYFTIGTGIAGGLAAIILGNKFQEDDADKSTLYLSIGLVVIATLVGAYIIKKSNDQPAAQSKGYRVSQ